MKNSILSEELTGFTKICKIDQLKEFEGKRFIVDEIEIALIKKGSEVYAISNICPHQHSALIYDGFIEEGYVVCPAHGWMFDLKTGKLPSGSKGLDTYEVKISDNDVYVKVTQKNWNW